MKAKKPDVISFLKWPNDIIQDLFSTRVKETRGNLKQLDYTNFGVEEFFGEFIENNYESV